MSKLLERIDSVDSGLQPSRPLGKKTLWDDGENIVFVEQSAQPIPGDLIFVDKLEAEEVRGMLEASIISGADHKKTLFWGSIASLFKRELGSSAVDLTRTSPAGYNGIKDETTTKIATRWSFAQWNTWIMATNGVDVPQIYKGSGDFDEYEQTGAAALPFTKAEVFRKLKTFLLAYNTDNIGPEGFEWCHDDDAELWDPAADNAAGNLPVRDIKSPIICVTDLGKGHGVYGRDRLHQVTYVGAPFYFAENHLLDGLGAVSKDSVVAVGRLNYGLGPKGFFKTDGFQVEYIDEPDIRDYVFGDINRNQLSQVVGWDDAASHQVAWFYPSSGARILDRAVAYNYNRGLWTKLGYQRTAGTSSSVFSFSITGDKNGNIYQQSVEGQLPASPGSPLELIAEAVLTSGGYGQFGYGQGGYGDTITLVG
jgi:hypothetical protein